MNAMYSLSVIIPTYRRPAFLPRAVESALSLGADIEVVVVPNGNDDSWQTALSGFRGDSRVRVIPVECRGANAARNAGLKVASAQYLRFLDDDDYLYTESSRRQFDRMRLFGADISSGDVDLVDHAGRILRTAIQPQTEHIAEAMLSPARVALITAHIFRAELVRELRWKEDLDEHHDIDWMLQVCRLPDIRWYRHPESVGVWVQHHGKRISRGKDPGPRALANSAKMMLAVVEALSARDELLDRHRAAAAEGLWNLVQKGVLYEISYWRMVALAARQLAPGSKPPSPVYHLPFLRKLDPLLIAIFLLPARWLLRLVRMVFPAARR